MWRQRGVAAPKLPVAGPGAPAPRKAVTVWMWQTSSGGSHDRRQVACLGQNKWGSHPILLCRFILQVRKVGMKLFKSRSNVPGWATGAPSTCSLERGELPPVRRTFCTARLSSGILPPCQTGLKCWRPRPAETHSVRSVCWIHLLDSFANQSVSWNKVAWGDLCCVAWPWLYEVDAVGQSATQHGARVPSESTSRQSLRNDSSHWVRADAAAGFPARAVVTRHRVLGWAEFRNVPFKNNDLHVWSCELHATVG